VTLHRDGGGCGRWRSRKSETWWRRRKDALLLVAWWCGRRNSHSCILVVELQLASKAHGDDEGLGIVDLDVEAEWWLESRREGLDVLSLR